MYTIGGNADWCTVESSMEIPQKIKNESTFGPSDPTSGNIAEETQNTNSRHTHPYVHCSVICNHQDMEAAQCPSVDEWIKQLRDIYTLEYSSAIEKKKILSFTTVWMDLQKIMLSGMSQS